MSLVYLLDTNTISEPIKKAPNQQVLNKITHNYSICALSVFTVYELIKGANLLTDSKKRFNILTYIEKTITELKVLNYTKEAAIWNGEEAARLQRIGKQPPIVDAQIAAVAQTHNLILVTRNLSDFSQFSNLKLENWFN